jgi:hypothetical protein
MGNPPALAEDSPSLTIAGVIAHVDLTAERGDPSKPPAMGRERKEAPSLHLSPHSFVAGREGRRRWLANHCLRGPAALSLETCVKTPAFSGR